MIDTATRTKMTLAQAIAHHTDYSFGDVQKVTALLEAAGATQAYQPAVNEYIACQNAAGQVVAYLLPGYITILDRSNAVIERDPATGRPMVKSIENGKGWDFYLSNWGRILPPKDDDERVIKERTHGGEKPQRVHTHAHETCWADDCGAWVYGAEIGCRKHRL